MKLRGMQETKILDIEGVLSRLDNDRELFHDLVELFFSTYDEAMQAIVAASRNHDMKGVECSAHSIKGALGNIGAMKAHAVAFALERLGRAQSSDNLDELLSALTAEIQNFRSEYERMRSRGVV